MVVHLEASSSSLSLSLVLHALLPSPCSDPTPPPAMADDTPASSSVAFPSPPACMHTDVPSAADGARRRLLPKRSFIAGLIPRRRRTKSLGSVNQYAQVPSPDHASEQERPAPTREPSGATTGTGELVHLESSLQVDAELDEDYNKDVYRWAILYENQRG